MSLLRRPLELFVESWKALPVYCSNCGYPNPADSVGQGETVGWCTNCQRVFYLPLLRIPGWITGVLGFLTVNLLCLS
jgi:hypothetical protein